MNLKNVAASVRARLTNHARATQRPFQEVLQYYGLERFLYRLAQSEHRDRFVLKGALLMNLWRAPFSRPTRDIDLLGHMDSSVENLEKIIRAVCAVEVIDDGMKFDPDTVVGKRIKEDADYEGVRVVFAGLLERAKVPMQIDIGFGDIVHPAAHRLSIYARVSRSQTLRLPARDRGRGEVPGYGIPWVPE